MKIRPLRLWFGGVALLAVSIGVFLWLRPARPVNLNLILITLDTTRADRLGCYGHQSAMTPVLDRLARRGIAFERAYTPVPLTLPAHASILTGLNPPEHGLHNNGQGALSASLPTLATELAGAGYDTGAFVAAFVLDKRFGLSRGFGTYDDNLDKADGTLHGHHRYRAANFVIDAALSWIQPRANKPFFCWVHLFDPHFPYLAHSERFGNKFADEPYDGELAYVDAELGRFFGSLDRAGILERSMIVVVGDHGESLGEHGELAHSMTVYDATLRVPLLISVPDISCPGHRVDEPVSVVDICATVLDCLGRSPIPETSGRSLRPALRGQTMSAQACFAETDEPYQTARWAPLRALITSQWKYIRSPKAELYDLLNDPHELQDLAHRHPEQLQLMERQLAEWEQRMHQRSAGNVTLTERERRVLNSLGYATRSQMPPDDNGPLRDIKDMLPFYNQLNDANAMMDAGRNDLAEPLLRRILAGDDQFFLAHGDLGRCLLRQDRAAEAIVPLRRSVELDPGADRVRAMLGAALLLNGDLQEAVEELQTTIESNPDLYEARFNLGFALEKLGRVKEAIYHYQTCLDRLPEFEPARQRLEVLLKR